MPAAMEARERVSKRIDKKAVYRLTSQIPMGRVSTYGAIAGVLGRPRAARAVGRILKVNPTPIVVPCHRVVHSDSRLGGYGGASGAWRKMRLLQREGVRVKDGRVLDLPHLLFTDFQVA